MDAMIIYGEVEEQLHSFLTMALYVCVQSTSHPGNIKLSGPKKQSVCSRHSFNGGFLFSFKGGVHRVTKSWNHRIRHSIKHHSMQNIVLWNQQYYSSITGFAYTGTLNE
jgi:hypothetical protein